MSILTIQFRDNNRLIASEVVFPDDIERNLINAFRFALKAYLYYKDLALLDFSLHSKIHHQTVARHIGISKQSSLIIRYDIAKQACEFYGVKFEYLYHIAQQFVKNPEYNSISFIEDGTVIFVKAFKISFVR